MNLPEFVGSVPLCPTHWILLRAFLFSSNGENANTKHVHKKKQILAHQTPTPAKRLSLEGKTRMFPEKWRNNRTECSREQRIVLHDLTSCQEFCTCSTSHTTLNQSISSCSSARFIWSRLVWRLQGSNNLFRFAIIIFQVII